MMAVLVCTHTLGFTIKANIYHIGFPADYDPVTNKRFNISTGDTRIIHTVKITDDEICEACPNEVFFCNISLLNDNPRIKINQDYARVMIADSMELECSRFQYYTLYLKVMSLFNSPFLSLQLSPHLSKFN